MSTVNVKFINFFIAAVEYYLLQNFVDRVNSFISNVNAKTKYIAKFRKLDTLHRRQQLDVIHFI